MTRRKSITGALVLCALSLCAFGVASASAAGLTAVECLPKAGGSYGTSECATPATGSGFETVAIEGTVSVEGTLTGGDTILSGTVALAKVDVSCKKSTTTGSIKNIVVGEEMRVQQTGVVTHYEECTARLASDTGVNKEACKVKAITGGQGEGKVTTVSLKGESGPEHVVTVEPEVGTTISEFEIIKEAAEAGKTCAVPTAKVTVTGKVAGTANTENHSHVTIAGGGANLKANGAPATYVGTYGGHTTAPNNNVVVGAQTFP